MASIFRQSRTGTAAQYSAWVALCRCPGQMRRCAARHQLFENPLLVRASCCLARFTLQFTANQWPTQDFNDAVRRPSEPHEKGAVRKPPFLKVESLNQLLDHHLLGQAHAVYGSVCNVNTALRSATFSSAGASCRQLSSHTDWMGGSRSRISTVTLRDCHISKRIMVVPFIRVGNVLMPINAI